MPLIYSFPIAVDWFHPHHFSNLIYILLHEHVKLSAVLLHIVVCLLRSQMRSINVSPFSERRSILCIGEVQTSSFSTLGGSIFVCKRILATHGRTSPLPSHVARLNLCLAHLPNRTLSFQNLVAPNLLPLIVYVISFFVV